MNGERIIRILVVGAGSTGGYFGGRLAQAGRNITFLLRPPRADHLRLNGLQIVSPHSDVS
jgi:2-dehydropantoate 2-reductase